MSKKNQSCRLTRQHKCSPGVVGDIPMRHSIPVLPFLRRSAVALLVPALALFALVLPARADSPSLFGLTVNGDDIAYASGTGWTFDGATVSPPASAAA